jgi:hypothetical protein
MRDVTVVLKYEIPAIRNSDFLTGNVCFLLLLYSNVQIIKRKYIMTNIDTQETDYSV